MNGTKLNELTEKMAAGSVSAKKMLVGYVYSKRYNPTLSGMDVVEQLFRDNGIKIPNKLTAKYRNKLWEKC